MTKRETTTKIIDRTTLRQHALTVGEAVGILRDHGYMVGTEDRGDCISVVVDGMHAFDYAHDHPFISGAYVVAALEDLEA